MACNAEIIPPGVHLLIHRSSVRGEHFKVQGRVQIAPDEDFPGTITEVHGSSNVNETVWYPVKSFGGGEGRVGRLLVSVCVVP